MENYCVSCKENTANKSSRVRKTKLNRLMLFLNCAACRNKNEDLLNSKNSIEHYLTISIIFGVISLNWIKLWKHFCWLETSLCPNCI